MLLTSERIKESLSFDPSTGIFVWKVKTGRSKPGMIAGSLNSFGYRQISLEPIPVGVYCCSQFGHGQRATTEAYTQYVRLVSTAQDQNGK